MELRYNFKRETDLDDISNLILTAKKTLNTTNKFILVINQLDAQDLFYNKFISSLYMFRAPCAHRQELKVVLYSLWYHHTYRWPSRARHLFVIFLCFADRASQYIFLSNKPN